MLEEYGKGAPQLFYGSQGDFVIYGLALWPSFSYWLIPGTELED